MQETLIIFKPDCIEKRIVGEVISRFEATGFNIVAAKVMQLDNAILTEHYKHISELPFFPEIKAFMSRIPVIIMILSGENVITKVRELLGPTDSKAAPKGTIRGDLGTDKMLNVLHASDGPEAAAEEKARFFPEL